MKESEKCIIELLQSIDDTLKHIATELSSYGKGYDVDEIARQVQEQIQTQISELSDKKIRGKNENLTKADNGLCVKIYTDTPFLIGLLSEDAKSKRFISEHRKVRAVEFNGSIGNIELYRNDGTHYGLDIRQHRMLLTAEKPDDM